MATGPWVLVSPYGVRYYVRDEASLCALADYNSSDKMTSSNLRAYVSANHCSTAARRPAQHIKQWQLLERVMAVQRDDTGEMYLVFGDAKHFIAHHSKPGMETIDAGKLQSTTNLTARKATHTDLAAGLRSGGGELRRQMSNENSLTNCHGLHTHLHGRCPFASRRHDQRCLRAATSISLQRVGVWRWLLRGSDRALRARACVQTSSQTDQMASNASRQSIAPRLPCAQATRPAAPARNAKFALF